MFVFFFFQAEDGIRDYKVTGVQTCALPILVVDAALTPVQQKTLEEVTKSKVIDRTGLILEIFGERAATAEGRLQVELEIGRASCRERVKDWVAGVRVTKKMRVIREVPEVT